LPDGSLMDARDAMPAMDAAESGVEPTTEAGMDAGMDAAESGVEPTTEAGMDAGMDAAESGVEPTTEAGMDAGMDAAESGVEPTTEAGMDAGVDAAPDAAMDARDTGVDTGVLRPTRCADVPVERRGTAVQTLYYGARLDQSWQAYCDFMAEGGPWTLIAKVDPGDANWGYDSMRWEMSSVFNESSTNTNRENAQFRGFDTLPFTALRVQFHTDQGAGVWSTRALSFNYDSGMRSLRLVFKDFAMNTAIMETMANDWINLVPNVLGISPFLHSACRRIAFNNGAGGRMGLRVRIGIIGDDSGGCNSPNSWIGVGGNPTDGVGGSIVAGNYSVGEITDPTFFRRTRSWVFIWVR
jgi:hypothetical protein